MNVNDRTKKVVFRPNNSYSAGVRLHLFGIAVEGSVAIPLAEKSVARFGSSEVSDIFVNMFSKKWMADFTRQHYSGFYFDRSWAPLANKEIHPQLPDMEVKNSAVNLTYIMNHEKFSMRAPFQFTEHQIKSSGSFLLGFGFSKFQADGGSEIISSGDQLFFNEGKNARQLNMVTLGLMPGYSYNLVVHDYFLNVTATAGPAHYWISYLSNDEPKHFDIDLNLSASYRAAVGYNGEHFFCGISFSAHSSQSRILETQFASSVQTLRLLIGFRFQERGIFTRRISDLRKPKVALQ